MKNWKRVLYAASILGTGFALCWVLKPQARLRAAALVVVDADARGVRCSRVGREIEYSGARILAIVVFFMLHISVLVGALLGLMGVLTFLPEQMFGLLGLGALGSVAAFSTACRGAMKRVPYVRPWWKRAWRCVYRASQVEALFLMLAGVSVGAGSYLVAYLVSLLSSSNGG